MARCIRNSMDETSGADEDAEEPEEKKPAPPNKK
jgi:hypothetical protein